MHWKSLSVAIVFYGSVSIRTIAILMMMTMTTLCHHIDMNKLKYDKNEFLLKCAQICIWFSYLIKQMNGKQYFSDDVAVDVIICNGNERIKM